MSHAMVVGPRLLGPEGIEQRSRLGIQKYKNATLTRQEIRRYKNKQSKTKTSIGQKKVQTPRQNIN